MKKRLAAVHPILAAKVRDVIEALAAKGIEARVVQGLRTYAEQNALYSQGRLRAGPKVTNARGGYSNHNFGLAVDLCPFVNGKPQWNDNHGFNMIGVYAGQEGLQWGGAWKRFVDLPHVELANIPTLENCRTLFKAGGLAKIWKFVN